MSTPLPSRYNWKSAVVAVTISSVAVAIVYFAFGHQLITIAEEVADARKAQRELAARFEQINAMQSQIDEQLGELDAIVRTRPEDDVEARQQFENIQSKATQQKNRQSKLEDAVTAGQAAAARHRSQTVMLVHRGRQIEQRLADLQVAAASWEELLHRVVTDNSGRRIASSGQHLELIATVIARAHVTPKDVESWKQEFDALYAPVWKAEAGARSVFVADDGFEPASQTIEKRIDDAITVLRKDTLLIEAMKRETANREPAELTLKDALAGRELNAVRQEANDLSIARAQAELEAARRREKAEADNIAAQTEVEEAELARQAAERRAVAAGILDEQKKLDLEAQLAEQRRQLELDYSRELPEIRRLLHPFITPGIFQPSRNGFDSRYRPESMSLTAIAGTGALEKTDKGLAELFRVGGSEFTAMRGLGSFPAHHVQNLKRDPSVRKRVERAQELLLKYGDLLAEKGILLD